MAADQTDREQVLERTAAYVERTLGTDTSGHDWWHIYRVWQLALQIGRAEAADLFVVQLAALLHDIADWKFHAGDNSVGPRVARAWLVECGVDEATAAHVSKIVEQISFKGAGLSSEMSTVEGRVVQDADRFDALGAIGIARAFAYGGHKGRAMYDPAIPPERHDSFEAYKNSRGPTINHFYEKLLLLKHRMQTATGRAMAEERHRFMEQFLDRFFEEWRLGSSAEPAQWRT